MAYQGLIDLRSDTVTRPTPEMRKAMAEAEVGDDVFGDDPTVNALQERAAEIFGKEAGVFVPTGSMGNQVCLGALARPGDEVICESNAHFLHYEGGSVSAHLGLMVRPLAGERGVLDPDAVGAAIRPGSEHHPRTAVVAFENTHNAAGGAIFPLEVARSLAKVARDADAFVHLDGARIFNAQAATGEPVSAWAECADTVSFCFSKGLGAPVGSMAVGDSDAMAEAHRLRKRLGGGMRQAGVIAAAARVALETGPDRLIEDHENARRLAEGIEQLAPGAVDVDTVTTNMVYVDLRPIGWSAAECRDRLAEKGIVTIAGHPHMMRLVTHRDVSSEDVDRVLVALKDLIRNA